MRLRLSRLGAIASLTLLIVPGARAQFQDGSQSQSLDLPLISQRALTTQRIGITDITVSYHRPLVSGRKIWSALVPYGDVWRAGANENTTIEFSDPVSIEGHALAKGIYGLHMIPNQNEWTIIFSSNSTSWGSFSYDPAEDALRVTVKPQPGEFQEALAYEFDHLQADRAELTLRWEKLAVPVAISVDVAALVAKSLPLQLRGYGKFTWEANNDAATYLLENHGSLDEALHYADLSVQDEEIFDNDLTKARILDAMNRGSEATALRRHALAIASARQLHVYGRQLQLAKKQDEAFEIFKLNLRRNPDDWTSLNEAARMAAAAGDFDSAVKEMKLSLAVAPDSIKPSTTALITRLQNKENIN